MKAVTVPAGEPGIRYVSGSLRQGLALGRAVASRIEGMTAEAIVPGDPPVERILEFDRGGLGPSVVGMLGSWLRSRFGGAALVVELPLWRPGDRVLAVDKFETAVIDQGVYATCCIDEAPDKVEATITSADPAFMYHAMLFPARSRVEISGRSGNWQERLANAVLAVMVGAYDGEGFVLCRRSD